MLLICQVGSSNPRQPPPEKAKRKRKNTEVTFLREEEVERLFGVITSLRDRAIFRVAYHAGLCVSRARIPAITT